MPESGWVDQIKRNLIAGWALDTDHPDQPVTIVVTVNGQVHGRVMADLPRDDARLIELLKERIRPDLHAAMSGRYGFSIPLDPPLSVFRAHEIEVRFERSGTLLPRGSGRIAAPEHGQAPLMPLLVVAAGRSGTTVLMQHLARHPGIVVADPYPHEIKLMTYYADAYRVLSMGADHRRSTSPDSLLRDGYTIGFNPYHRRELGLFTKTPDLLDDYFETTVPPILNKTFGTLLMGYYTRIQADQGKAGARYFAEKVPPRDNARDGVRVLCGDARQILLVRDPRDILCSARAFWNTGPEAAFRNVSAMVSQLEAVHASDAGDLLLIRYEDLVTDTPGTLARLWSFLDLPPPQGQARPDDTASIPANHGTSRSLEASIGRWRAELPAEEQARCEQAFGGFLDRFGYAR